MQAIQNSRLLKNLWRDINNEYKPDESLSILNASGVDIEYTDDTTKVTKIIYPRTILHTNRPESSITIKVVDESTDEPTYTATIDRSQIKKQLIAIETPIKYNGSTDSYAEFLLMNWYNKIIKKADTVYITPFSIYYSESTSESDSYHLSILILIILSAILCFVLLFS